MVRKQQLFSVLGEIVPYKKFKKRGGGRTIFYMYFRGGKPFFTSISGGGEPFFTSISGGGEKIFNNNF